MRRAYVVTSDIDRRVANPVHDCVHVHLHMQGGGGGGHSSAWQHDCTFAVHALRPEADGHAAVNGEEEALGGRKPKVKMKNEA